MHDFIYDIRFTFDFLDHPTQTIYTKGCNLRCDFCCNSILVKKNITSRINFSYIKSITSNCPKHIVISGGEPCMHDDLPDFIGYLKNKNFLVGICTNGTYPYTLKACNPDYVILSIKSKFEGGFYTDNNVIKIKETINYVLPKQHKIVVIKNKCSEGLDQGYFNKINVNMTKVNYICDTKEGICE